MFYIDSWVKDETISFDEARRIVTCYSNTRDLLDAMKTLEARLLEERNRADEDDCISEFYYDWSYELNAFNKVFSEMSKLFAPKKR